MFRRIRRHPLFLIALVLVVAVVGCGRKGPLYLPSEDGKRAADQSSPAPAK